MTGKGLGRIDKSKLTQKEGQRNSPVKQLSVWTKYKWRLKKHETKKHETNKKNQGNCNAYLDR